LGLPFTIYVVLQLIALVTVRGKYRVFVMAPALLGAAIVAWTILSYQRHANLWPLGLIYGGPLAAALVIAVWISAIVAKRAESNGINNP
jgi:hypothetical protein